MDAYQRKRGNPYRLPHNVYMGMQYLVRDYERLGRYLAQSEEDAELGITVDADARQAARERRRAVERALEAIPREYRAGLLRSICAGVGYPPIASASTWRRQRARLIWQLAYELHLTG